MSLLKTRWTTAPLGRVAELNARTLPETTDPDFEFRYVDIGSVGRGILVEEPQKLTFEKSPSRARRILRPGDTIVSTVRTYLRAVMRVPDDATDLIGSTGFAVLTAQPRLDPRFLSWFAQSDPFIEEVVARSVGVSYPAISPSELARLPVAIPDLPTQRRTADFLDTETARIDALTDKKHRLIEVLDARFRAEIDRLMEGISASEAALGRFVLALGQGASLQADSRPAEGEEWGVLKVSAVKAGHYLPQENKALFREPEEPPLVPQAGDLLVTRSNTPSYVGDVAAVARTSARRMLPDLIYRLRLDHTRISTEFAAYALLTSRSRHRISALARGSSQSMVKLRGEDIRSLPVPFVPLEVQARTVSALKRTDHTKSEIIGKIRRQIDLLTERRQALITAAVTGQIGIPGVAT